MAEDINKRVEDIINRLQETRDIVQFFQEIARFTSLSSTDAKALSEALKTVSKNTKDIAFNFESAAKGAKKVSEAQKDLNKAQRAQRNLGIEINKLLKQQGFNQDEINKLLSGTSDDREYIKKLAKEALDIDLGAIDAAFAAYKAQQDNVAQEEENLRISKNYNDALGLTGGLVKSVADGMQKLGIDSNIVHDALTDAKDEMIALADELTDSGDKAASFADKTKIMAKGLGSLVSGVAKGLVDPLFLAEQLMSAIGEVDEQAGKLAKNFGISYNQALGIASELSSAANTSYLLNVTAQGLGDAFIEINNRYGTFAQISEETLETFTNLKETTDLTAESLGMLVDLSVITGRELEDITKEFLGQAKALAMENGLALNQKEILETINDISDATLLTLNKEPQALAKAVVQAKALGVSLGQVEKTAESLLNFESSIQAELEAELFTGKQINLEEARLAALKGDVAAVAEEIAKQVGTAAEFTEMNVFAQRSLAESLGMTRDELAGALKEREALAALSAQEGESLQEAYQRSVATIGLEATKKKLGDESYANLLASQTVQEKFLATTQKLQEVFVSIATPLLEILSPIVDLVTFFMPGLVAAFNLLLKPIKLVGDAFNSFVQGLSSTEDILKNIGKLLIGIAGTYALIKAIQLGITAQKQIQQGLDAAAILKGESQLALAVGKAVAWAIANPFTALAGLAVAGSVAGAIYSQVKDGVIGPDGGLVVSGEKGTYQLDKNDTVIAGTELGAPTAGASGGVSVDMGPVVAKLEELLSVVRAGGTITIDGQAVGKALTMASYTTGS